MAHFIQKGPKSTQNGRILAQIPLNYLTFPIQKGWIYTKWHQMEKFLLYTYKYVNILFYVYVQPGFLLLGLRKIS